MYIDRDLAISNHVHFKQTNCGEIVVFLFRFWRGRCSPSLHDGCGWTHEFYSWKCYILVRFSNHYLQPSAHWGSAWPPYPRLNTPLCRGTVQTTMSHVCSHSNSYNWRNHVRLMLNALNSSIFICHLNAMYDLVVNDRRRQSLSRWLSGLNHC